MRAVNRQQWFPHEGHVDTVFTLTNANPHGAPRMATKSYRICPKLGSRYVTQAFKNLTWVLIMIPELARTMTGVKPEIT